MNNTIAVNKYFRASNLDENTTLLSTKLPFLSEYNVPYCIDALESQHYEPNKKIILDISQQDYIDSTSIILLYKKIAHIVSRGGKIYLLISKIKPTISYSIGNQVTELNEYCIQQVEPDLIIN